MPVCEADPWRLQYFEGVPCPEHVRVPTEDADAFAWNPRHNWIYDRLRVAQSQGLPCGTMAEQPPSYPVFAKPIVNLRGMGMDSAALGDAEDYRRFMREGLFWSALLTGEHLSSDVAVVDGEACWWRHTWGMPVARGTFDYWTVLAAPQPSIETYCNAWIARNLAGYTGMANFETIGGRIIEAHLRFADQWPDIYGGRRWVEAVIRLYETGKWRLDDADRREGYSVVLFGPHGVRYRHPPRALIEDIAATDGVSSVQITFHEDKSPDAHAMPPGGFRLAVVNAWDLEAGRAARARLARVFDEQAQTARHIKRRASETETREGDVGSG